MYICVYGIYGTREMIRAPKHGSGVRWETRNLNINDEGMRLLGGSKCRRRVKLKKK